MNNDALKAVLVQIVAAAIKGGTEGPQYRGKTRELALEAIAAMTGNYAMQATEVARILGKNKIEPDLEMKLLKIQIDCLDIAIAVAKATAKSGNNADKVEGKTMMVELEAIRPKILAAIAELEPRMTERRAMDERHIKEEQSVG